METTKTSPMAFSSSIVISSYSESIAPFGDGALLLDRLPGAGEPDRDAELA